MTVWRRASECSSADCVEVGVTEGQYLVRDSKDPAGPVLAFTSDEWVMFVAGVKAGEFGTPPG